MNNNRNLWIAVIVVAIIAVIGVFSPQVAKTFGSITTNLPSIGLADLSVGSTCGDGYTTCNGTDITGLIATSCNLIGTDGSQAASTTVAYDCAVTNLTSSYKVIAQLASSTGASASNPAYVITAAKASSTAGYATVLLRNMNDTASVPSANNIGSSTSIWAYK